MLEVCQHNNTKERVFHELEIDYVKTPYVFIWNKSTIKKARYVVLALRVVRPSTVAIESLLYILRSRVRGGKCEMTSTRYESGCGRRKEEGRSLVEEDICGRRVGRARERPPTPTLSQTPTLSHKHQHFHTNRTHIRRTLSQTKSLQGATRRYVLPLCLSLSLSLL